MTIAVLDTHRIVKRLTATGMPEAQAEAVADIVKEGHEATKAEVTTREILRYELALVEERLNRRADESEARTGKHLEMLGARISVLDKDLTIRLGGMLAASVAIVGTMVALF
jgi:hypothetical protein